MHRVAKFDLSKQFNNYVDPQIIEIMEELKKRYSETNDLEDYLSLLKTIYSQRKNHRLLE